MSENGLTKPDQPAVAVLSRDRSGAWLVTAAIGLAVLTGAAATVSFSAQYQMVHSARGLRYGP